MYHFWWRLKRFLPFLAGLNVETRSGQTTNAWTLLTCYLSIIVRGTAQQVSQNAQQRLHDHAALDFLSPCGDLDIPNIKTL